MSYDHRKYDGAERALVAAALLDVRAYADAGIHPEDFFNPKAAIIWRAIGELHEKGELVDVVTVGSHLADGVEAIGGLSGLSQFLVDSPGSVAAASTYANIVREGWSRRNLMRALSDVSLGLERNEDLERIYSRLSGLLDGFYDLGSNPAGTSLLHKATEELDRIRQGRAAERGLATGLDIETVVPGGIPRDKVTVICGETGNFKTTLKDNLIDAITAAGYYTINFTLEDTAQLASHCLLARYTGIPYSRIWNGSVDGPGNEALEQAIASNADQISRMITIDDCNPHIDSIILQVNKIAHRHPVAAVFIDYVQLLDYGKENEPQALKTIVKKCQAAAKKGIAYVLLSQLNYEKIRQRDDKRPQLSDLFGSSALAQGCKLAIATYRPARYEPVPKASTYKELVTTDPLGQQKYENTIELWILKNRVGDSDVCVRSLVEPQTGKMAPWPTNLPVQRVGSNQLRSLKPAGK